MPIVKRPDAEIPYEVHGTGFPLLLFAPGGLRSEPAFWRQSPSNPAAPPPWMNPMGEREIARLAPNLEIQKDRRAPAHLAESIRRVTGFLTRHTR